MSKNQKKKLARIIATAVLFATAILLSKIGVLTGYGLLLVYLPIYLLIGYDIIIKAVTGVFNGQMLDENFLMTIATIGAFFIGEYPEALLVMLLYQVGEFFQDYAVGKSRESITELMDIRPDYANINKDGVLVKVDPEDVQIGDEIVVTAGEKIPLDGVVLSGTSSVDTSALTGESVPRTLREGDQAISGGINLNGMLTIRVTKLFTESTVSKILDLVENASSNKAHAENFITKFAKYYTPLVVLGAVLLAVIPPLFIQGQEWRTWIYRALTFLVISCPCALVISVPLSFFGGIGGASRQGILVKGSNYLEVLDQTRTIVFDKTGTLTEGVFEVVEVQPAKGITEEELIHVTALAESYSTHPISNSLKIAHENIHDTSLENNVVEGFQDVAGHGISAVVDNQTIYAGNNKLMDSIGVAYEEPQKIGTVVHVARGTEYIGHIVIADRIKKESFQMIKDMKAQNIHTVMLTGDSDVVGRGVAKELGIDEVFTELLPADKVTKLEEIMDRQTNKKSRVAFVGDGINDAPVLSRSDLGISMGALGSDAAIEASDIVLMDDNPNKISTAMDVARRTLRIVKQNISFALIVKAVALVLGALGMANIAEAVFADVGVSIIAILNAMRALQVKK